MEKYDLIIVGAGPAGIFTAVELLRHGSKKKMLLVEKGKPVEKRHCPKAEVGHCVNCRPTCAITTGFSGAGAFSDGKLSLSYEVGGDLPTLIGEEFAQELIDYTDKIYLEFGADPHVEGIYTGEDIKEIRKNAIHAGLKLVDCPIRHLGTEKAQELYLAIQNYLADNGVEMRFNTECENIILEEDGCKGVLLKDGDLLTRLTALSRFLLYPAVALLAIGIFVGAVWANVSWGAYWSWDPKETWALILLMIYAVPLHQTPIVKAGRPRRYHIYVLAAFLAVVITYFGVNYFMTGMHSYA